MQRGEGLRKPDETLARHRRDIASQPPARFSKDAQQTLIELAGSVAEADAVKLHAIATTPTHLHALISFPSPACQCGAQTNHCPNICPARQHAANYMTHFKRVTGGKLSVAAATPGRKWFSRGGDVSRVHNRDHFDRLVSAYLPKHVHEHGQFWRAPAPD